MTPSSLPAPSDRAAAHLVTTLWARWVDPVAMAFEELEADQALDDLRRRAAAPQPPVAPADPSAEA